MRLFGQAAHAQAEPAEEDGESGGEDNGPESEAIRSLNDSMVEMNIEGDEEDDDESLRVRTRTLGFEAVDNEILGVSDVLESISYENRVTYAETAFERSNPIPPENDATETNELSIQIGYSDIARFSCACHKLNVVIKTAVQSQKILKLILKKLGSFAASSRNNIEINRIFNDAHCRPVLENKTRWFSQLYVLMWAQNCYKKKSNIFKMVIYYLY